MKKLDGLQIGRAIAVISVLVFHLTGLSVEYARGCFYAPWTEVLRAGVDVFFVISGVVMVVTTYENFGKPGSARRFIVHRISRIYPPYLVLTMLLVILWLVEPGSVNRSTGGANLLESFTLWPSPRQLPLVQVGWTLSFEMLFYLVFFLLMLIVKKSSLARTLVAWAVSIAVGSIAIQLNMLRPLVQAMPRLSFVLSPYVLEFVTGCFLGLAWRSHKSIFARGWSYVGVGIFALEAIAFQVTGVGPAFARSSTIVRVGVFGPPAVFLVFGLLSWEADRKRWWLRQLIVCGNISYSIYLVHLLVIHFAYRYTWRLYGSGATRVLFLAITPAAAFVASVAYYRWVEQPLPLWVKARLEQIVGVQPGSSGVKKRSVVAAPRPAPAE
jgi:peptidoglycan/LPS O-acetylase OafA/YrhL